MSETFIAGPQTKELATDLLAAAEELGLPVESIRTGDDGFYVPEEVADKVYPPKDDDDEPGAHSEENLTVDQLKDQLRDKGLAVSGNKDELQARLDEANSAPAEQE